MLYIIMGLHLVSSSEEPPSGKRVRTMEDEGVEQLQTTVLDLVEARVYETTITGEAGQEHVLQCTCTHVLMYLNPPSLITHV